MKTTTKKACAPATCKRLLTDTGTSALALTIAAKELLGDWMVWEPETIWMTLLMHSVEVPPENRAKLMAAQTLCCMPSFYWDGIVFEKTALALSGIEPNADVLEEATTAQLAWAVVEAERIVNHYEEATREFDHEPCAYAAIIMYREGMVVAPAQLEFAQKALNRLSAGGAELREAVKKRYAELDKSKLKDVVLNETPEDVQIAHLIAVEVYVLERLAQLSADLALLTS